MHISVILFCVNYILMYFPKQPYSSQLKHCKIIFYGLLREIVLFAFTKQLSSYCFADFVNVGIII